MPGFSIGGIGGDRGGGPNSLSEVRRTHRWIFEGYTYVGNNVLLVLKSASRPSLTFEEPAMHHNQEQVYYAGKHTWESASMSWYDVEQDPDVSAAMWDWMSKCMQFQGNMAPLVSPPNQYKGTGDLNMVNGEGHANESWTMYNGWPQALNWGALDYTSSDLQLIEVKFRFDRAIRHNYVRI